MSDDTDADNSIESINWLEEAINKEHIKYYQYDKFNNIKEIGSGGFGKVYRADWINTVLALKAFEYESTDVKKIIRELNLQRKVDYHENIIRFFGVTKDNSLSQNKKYMMVMEYADGGSLQDYFKHNFNNLTWGNKYRLAYQIAIALECIHDEGIVHRDLNSNNILVHQHAIKLADFGLSRIIEEKSKSKSAKLFGVLPYMDPNGFENRRNIEDLSQNYKLNEKSDIYSLGILFWEISSGIRPFDDVDYDFYLAMKILQGLRETVVEGTPVEYVKLYTACWDGEPNKRPTIHQIVIKLNTIMSQENIIIKDNLNYDCENKLLENHSNKANASVNNYSSQEGITNLDIMNLAISSECFQSAAIKNGDNENSNFKNDIDDDIQMVSSKVEEKAETEEIITVNDAGVARTALGLAVIPFTQFIPLIEDVAGILSKIIDLYSTAQHNKKIVKLLMERIAAANSTVSILREDSLYTSNHYVGLRRLIQVILKMQKYSEDITQYNTVQKYLGAKTIEAGFNKLCREYDNSMIDLNIAVDFTVHADRENKILQDEIKELLQFQAALVESMDEKIDGTKGTLNALVEKVSEMAFTMQSLEDFDVRGLNLNQKKIDNIFHEPLLPFEEYDETPDTPRSDRLRKYVHVKTKQDFAFKTVFEECVDQVKNQVTILKQLKDCQNIIHFYGLTNDGNKYYLVTEWAENKNLREYIVIHGQNINIGLRIRFAYDIAKGLNFLNAVKIVHRDIRAENIVITEHDVAKITNFKLSRRFDAATRNLAVSEERVRYSAPEILRRMLTKEGEGNEKYDIKCEVYSFGIILWEIAECSIPYKFENFMEITKNVVSGYREPFVPGTDIPSKYQNLVNQAVNQNPGLRPTFAKMLTDLNDLINCTYEQTTSHPGRKPSVRKMSDRTIATADCALLSIDEAIDKAVEDHKRNIKDKKMLYEIFDTYANLAVPKAKYWKAYFIVKGYSDLNCSENVKLEIAAELLKEVADYGDEYPDAQLRYATMVMQGKGVEQNEKEAIEYFRKACKNDHVVAMFNLGTYYFSRDNVELGKYYLAKAASKKYDQAIQFCRLNNISYN